MEVRYCLEIRFKEKFTSIELYNRIKQYKANMIDLSDKIYVTGVAPYCSYCAVVEQCLQYGVIDSEVGIEKQRRHKASE